MRRCIDLSHRVAADVCIDLRGGDGRMAQHFLDDPHVRSTLQQVGGKGMSQAVRRYVCGELCSSGHVLQDSPGTLAGEFTASGIEENRGGTASSRRQLGSAAHEISLQRLDSIGAQGEERAPYGPCQKAVPVEFEYRDRQC